MAKIIDEKLVKGVDWENYSGKRVQEFIKEEFSNLETGKIGYVHKNESTGTIFFSASEDDFNENKYMAEVPINIPYALEYKLENNSKIFLSSSKEKNFTWYFKTVYTSNQSLINSEDITVEYKILNKSNNKETTYATNVSVSPVVTDENFTPVTMDLNQYLTDGNSTISVKIKGLRTRLEAQFSFDISIVDLQLEDRTEFIKPVSNKLISQCYVTCTKGHNAYYEYRFDEKGDFIQHNQSIEGKGIRSLFNAELDTTNLNDGKHIFEYRLFLRINAETYYTNTQRIEFIKNESYTFETLIFTQYGNNVTVKAEDGNLIINGIYQYLPNTMKYSIYNPNVVSTTNLEFYENNSIIATNKIQNGEIGELKTQFMEPGLKKVEIIVKDSEGFEIEGGRRIIYFNVIESNLGIKVHNENIRIDFNSVGKSNNSDIDKKEWVSLVRDYKATFNEEFDWSQGWTDNGLVINNKCELTFDYIPFPSSLDNVDNIELVGGDMAYTLEMEFMTQNVTNENAIVCDMKDELGGKCGFQITGSEFRFFTPGGDGVKPDVSTRFKSNELNRIAIVIRPNGEGNNFKGLVELYVNGILSSIAKYTYNDSFIIRNSDNSGKKLVFKPEAGADIVLKQLRTYNGVLFDDNIVDNYILSRNDSQRMMELFNKNMVLSDGNITPQSILALGNIPVLVFVGRTNNDEIATGDGNTGDGEGNCNEEYKKGDTNSANEENWYQTLEETTDKKKNIDMDVIYYNPLDKSKNFKFIKAYITPQGTSSMYYPKKNYRIYTQKNKDTRCFFSDMGEGGVGVLEFEDMMRWNFGEDIEGQSGANDRRWEKWRGTKNYKKRKYAFKDNSQPVKCWCLKADFAETSSSHNTGIARLWGDTMKKSKVSIGSSEIEVFKTKAQAVTENIYKDNILKMPDVRTTIDGFPIVVFGKRSYNGRIVDGKRVEDPYVFLGQYNFNNDKSTESVFGFCDINNDDRSKEEYNCINYDTNEVSISEFTLDNMLDKYMTCVETLDNGNILANFASMQAEDGTTWDEAWDKAFEFRYPEMPEEPEPKDYEKGEEDAKYKSDLEEFNNEILPYWQNTHLKPFKHFAKWIYDTRWCDVNGNILPEITEEEALLRKEKFAKEKWQHLDVWKIAAYYVYAMRFGAVDQIVKNSMLTSEGPFAYNKNGVIEDYNNESRWDGTDVTSDNYGKYYKWYYINYDNDTIMGVKNDGSLAYGPDILRTSVDKDGTYIYAGSNSTLWNNLDADDEFKNEILPLVDQGISRTMTYDTAIRMFDIEQVGKWCERIYNKDADYKYITPYIGNWAYSGTTEENFSDKLFMLQGSRTAHRRWWLSRRFNLFDGKWTSGEFPKKYIEVKCNYGSLGDKFSAVAGSDAYFGYKINNINRPGKYGEVFEYKTGDSINWELFKTIQIGDPIAIYGAVDMTELNLIGLSKNLTSLAFYFGQQNDIENKLERLYLSIPEELLNLKASYESFGDDLSENGSTVVKPAIKKLQEKYPDIKEEDFTSGKYKTYDEEKNTEEINDLFYRVSVKNDNEEVITYVYFARIENGVRNYSCKDISFNTLDKLKILKIAGYEGLSSLDLTKSKYIEEVDARYSNVNKIDFGVGATIEKLSVSDKFNSLVLDSCGNITLDNIMINNKLLKDNGGYNITNFNIKNSNGLNHSNEFKDFILKWMTHCINFNKSNGRMLILNGIKWTNVNIQNLKTMLDFKLGVNGTKPSICEISGEIRLGAINISSAENEIIKEFVKEFGINPVITSPIVLINKVDDIVAGESIELNSIVYATSDSNVSNLDVKYYFVKEDKNGAYVDNNTSKRYSIISNTNLHEVRSGLTLDGNIIKTEEFLLNEDTDVLIGAFLNVGIDKFDITSFTIKDPTYAIKDKSDIAGVTSLNDTGKTYEYKLGLLSNKNEEPIGSIDITWDITSSSNGLDFITSSVSEDNKTLFITTKDILPDEIQKTSDLKITALIQNKNEDFNDFSLEKDVLILNENILLTNISNKIVMDICHRYGWADSNVAMTKEEALAVTDIGTSFSNINEEEWSFDEFEYFTNVNLTSLKDGAFSGSNITSLKMPKNITKLGVGIFNGCECLSEITLSENITQIPEKTFFKCKNLNSIIIPDNVEVISKNSFGGVGIRKILVDRTNGIKSLLLSSDSKLYSIINDAFEENEFTIDNDGNINTTNVLEEIDITAKLRFGINSYNFLTTSSLTRVNIVGNEIVNIDNGLLYADAFKTNIVRYLSIDNDNKIEVSLPNVNTVYPYAFYSCKNLEKVIFGGELTIGDWVYGLFLNSDIEFVDFSECNKLERLPNYMFKGCSKLNSIKLPENGKLRVIGSRLFEDCELLSEVILPNTIEYAGLPSTLSYTFNRSGIVSLILPTNLIEIPRYFISNCAKLEEITFSKYYNTSQSNIHEIVVYCDNLKTVNMPLYSTTNDSSSNVYYIYRNGHVLCGPYDSNEAFVVLGKLNEKPTELSDNKDIREYEVSYEIREILPQSNVVVNNLLFGKGDKESFKNCNNIENFALHKDDNNLIMKTRDEGKSIIRVGDGNIADNTINTCGPKLVKVIYSATYYILPEDIKEIENGAFAYCGNLSGVTLNDSLETIGSYAFASCGKLEHIDLPNTLTSIGDSAFRGCGLKEIIIPENVNIITEYLFANCVNLNFVKILSSNLISIARFAFNSCKNLQKIIILTKNAPELKTGSEYYTYIFEDEKLPDPKIYAYHPFGYNRNTIVGIAFSGVKKLCIPYDSNGYIDNEKWAVPLLTTQHCNFKIEDITLENDIAIVDERLNNMDMVYVKRETNDNVETIPVLSPYNEGDPKRFVMLNSEKIYHGETIVVYSDEECNNEIGRFVAKYGTDSYNLTEDIVMGSTYSKSLFNTNIFEDEKIVENNDMSEMANITKHEYNLLLAKVNQLMKLLNKKK